MTLQPAAIASQDNFDVLFKVYAGPAYKDVDLSQYPMGVTPASLAAWTDVTERTIYSGSFTAERVSSTVRFSTTLNGTDYDASYFGPGQAILCLYNVVVAGTQIIPANQATTWATFFVGHIMEGGHEDDYRHGGRWSRQLGGLDSLLQRSTAPRLAAGRVNLLSNAAVTASSTLLIPALEAGTGEFAGSLVDVDADNTIDGNINTLWMSNDAPTSEHETEPLLWISKVFFKPVTGYNQTKLWWIEFWCPTNESLGDIWYLRNKAGQELRLPTSDDDIMWLYHQRFILCASQPDFEAYTGGASNIAKIIDARLINADFTLDPEDDWFEFLRGTAIRGAMAWNQDGSAPVGMEDTWGEHWIGNAIDVSDDVCPPGYGLRVKPDATVHSTASSYDITKILLPGDVYTRTHVEWLLYALEEQNAVLTVNATAGDTAITLSSTMGLLDEGAAICESDAFTYTGRTATGLTGIPATGANAIGNHLSGAKVYQTIDGVTQYGWPTKQLELLRPANPALPHCGNGTVYFVESGLTPPATPEDGEDEWESDYDGNPIGFYEPIPNGDVYDYGCILTSYSGEPRWIQYMLVVFNLMVLANTPVEERARLNEAKLYLSQTQIDNSGLGDIDTLSSSGLAQYLLTLAGVTLPLYSDAASDAVHLIGEHATAIMPYTRVLDDLARITGSVMYWGQASVISWRHDMWWPVGFEDAQLDPVANLDKTCLQGTVQYSGRKPDEAGVRIHARTPDGLHQYDATFPYNVTATDQLIEFDDLVVTASNVVIQLAESMYYKNGLNYTHGAQEIIFSVKGPGLWLFPELFVEIPVISDTGEVIDLADYGLIGGETHAMTSWLIESVTWEWGVSENNARTWKVAARGRRYWR